MSTSPGVAPLRVAAWQLAPQRWCASTSATGRKGQRLGSATCGPRVSRRCWWRLPSWIGTRGDLDVDMFDLPILRDLPKERGSLDGILSHLPTFLLGLELILFILWPFFLPSVGPKNSLALAEHAGIDPPNYVQTAPNTGAKNNQTANRV